MRRLLPLLAASCASPIEPAPPCDRFSDCLACLDAPAELRCTWLPVEYEEWNQQVGCYAEPDGNGVCPAGSRPREVWTTSLARFEECSTDTDFGDRTFVDLEYREVELCASDR